MIITNPSQNLTFAGATPAWMPRLAFSPAVLSDYHPTPRGDTLLVVFLRGAADTLNMLIPHGEQAYYRLRPTLGIPRPDDNRARKDERVLDLDGFFGLHPSLAPLLPAWQASHLALIPACGAPDESRSHFKAMELMERGVDLETGPASGWIGRHLASLDTNNPSPLRAIGLGSQTQRSLRGAIPITALRSIADFHLGGDARAIAQMRAALNCLYAGEDDLARSGQETLKILDTLQSLDARAYQPGADAHYPEGEFSLGLRQVAALIKAEVGLEVAAIDLGGWDTHFAQGSSHGQMANLMTELAEGLTAIYSDLHNQVNSISIVVMSEFGRRAYENGSLGTDHGHGSLMMAMGGAVAGGRIYGEWPGLEKEQLTGPGDLAVTTDYRDILAELCTTRLNNPATDEIFPGFTPHIRNIYTSQ